MLLATHCPLFQTINASVVPVDPTRTLQAYTPVKTGVPVLYLIRWWDDVFSIASFNSRLQWLLGKLWRRRK